MTQNMIQLAIFGLGSAEIIVLLALIGGIIAFFAVQADKKKKGGKNKS